MDRRDDARRGQSDTDPSPRDGQHRDADRALSRRGAVVGGAGLAAALGGGWYVFLRDDRKGPDTVAEEFVVAVDSSEFSRADEMIHPESPLDGAGDAADILVGVAGIGGAIDALDISVTDTETRQKSDGQAIVDVTIEIDLVVEQVDADLPLEMRTANGEWHVWNLSV
jgi:hypothetical protein